jgi:DNA-binding NtrC family response regulator
MSRQDPGQSRMLDVLFVDDEERVLDALRDALRSQRRGWRMRFAPGAREALRLLDEHPVDVIVADLRMPGMNGADLLAAIAEHHPQAVGIVLSGYGEDPISDRAAALAHAVLDKPCPPERLRAAIEQAAARHY